MACKDGISIYCLESKHVNNGTVETGCIKISENPMLTATTTTTTSATRFCPYKYGGFANAPNPCTVPACEDNSESDSCKSAVHKYCGASKETYMEDEKGCLNIKQVFTPTPTTTTTTSTPVDGF
jgi:hypothetical protein